MNTTRLIKIFIIDIFLVKGKKIWWGGGFRQENMFMYLEENISL